MLFVILLSLQVFFLQSGVHAIAKPIVDEVIINNRYASILDMVQQDEFLNNIITKSDYYADYYTKSEFLNPLLDQDGHRIAKQLTSNQKLYYQCDIDSALNFNFFPSNLSEVGLYHQDILTVSYYGLVWSLEWWFYTTIHTVIHKSYLQHLEFDENIWDKAKIIMTGPIFSTIMIYGCVSMLLSQAYHYYLLGTNNNKFPMSLTTLITTIQETFFGLGNIKLSPAPHDIADFMQDIFKKLHLIPAYFETTGFQMAQQCAALFLWAYLYIFQNLRPTIHKEFDNKDSPVHELYKKLLANKELPINNEQIEMNKALSEALETYLLSATKKPFFEWVTQKTTLFGYCFGIISMAAGLPCIYKLIKFFTMIIHNKSH